jgi:hypothetical protein
MGADIHHYVPLVATGDLVIDDSAIGDASYGG